MPFDRNIFFDQVRSKPFSGKLSQQQVDGMDAILGAWESDYDGTDLRWLAYPLATTYHETSQHMWPIEEYGKGKGMKYGTPDPKTGQTYYGRGYVQLTWADNYSRADKELGLSGDRSCYLHADNALDSEIAALVMFRGMMEGWFRSKDGSPNTLAKFFNETANDAFNAREIINGDKNTVPSWSNGKSIGKLIEGYHNSFLAALVASWSHPDEEAVAGVPEEAPIQMPAPAGPGPQPAAGEQYVVINIEAPKGIHVEVHLIQPEG